MNKKNILTISIILTGVFILVGVIWAQETVSVMLLGPQMENDKPLMQALKERKTQRDFSSKDLPLQVISDLLWAANGINRPLSGYRTAPSTMNMQEIDIYVAKSDGLYLYVAKENILKRVLTEDIRGLTGKQLFVKKAPINLIFVADLAKMGKTSGDDTLFYAATDTGFISENVYLYCASVGLATVVRGWIDKPELSKAMKLRTNQKIILAQTVGYPEK